MHVFSALYNLEEKGYSDVDYAVLADAVGLTESSIRDYVFRLIKKGIPIEKKKIHNKKVVLFVAQSLKDVASLATILRIRDV